MLTRYKITNHKFKLFIKFNRSYCSFNTSRDSHGQLPRKPVKRFAEFLLEKIDVEEGAGKRGADCKVER